MEALVERAHALLSASSAYRWTVCTAAPLFEEQFADKDSEFAKEGTWAHGLAELKLLLLLGQVDPQAFQNRLAAERSSQYWSKANEEAVDCYVEYCAEQIAEAREVNPDAVILVEERLDFSHIVPQGFGTGDLVIVADGKLRILDLKFGKGKPVSAVDNAQEKLYALGAVEAYAHLYEIDWVSLTIHQPRLSEEPSTWDISVKDLLAWGQKIKPIAEQAFRGGGEFVPGDHCGFCRGKVKCRARADANLVQVQGEFAPPNTLSDEEIAGLLAVAKERATWYGDLQSHALVEAENGTKFPGWKLVAGRSNRKYRDQEAVAKALTGAGIPAAVIYEAPSLLGITAMEKAITKKVFSEVLSDLVMKPTGKPTLVPASDPRPEVEIGSATDGFEIL
jgi:hypothetical protein